MEPKTIMGCDASDYARPGRRGLQCTRGRRLISGFEGGDHTIRHAGAEQGPAGS